VEDGLAETTGARARLASWALGVGGQVSALRRAGRPVPFGLRVRHRVADRLVFAKIKARLGGEVRYVVSGGAPLAKEIAEFFHTVDILVLEGYGLTEATTAITLNRPHRYRFGTVGPPFPRCEVRVADDGEIECRGPHVFAGYHGDPEATDAVLRPGGWLATGDVGGLDDDGFLSVTDRKKDLIVTAGGKNVAPQNIENLLRQRPAVSQVVVIGDRRPFLTTLVTLDPDELARVLPDARPGDERSRALVQRYLDEVNAELSSFEQIRRFVILDHDFSPESGELTPTLKVKRRLIADRYRSQIDALYAT
jgi:long-chain acyl-CoA synthetase